MRLRLETKVAAPPQRVWEGFNRELFLKLAPPFPPMQLQRFEGCQTGDVVEVELNLLLFKQLWVSRITDQSVRADEIYFVDEGQVLPFFLRSWRHRHRILPDGQGSRIVDDIEFGTPRWLPAALLYPSLWLQFAYRRPIYRRVFSAV